MQWQWRHNGLDGVSNHQPHHCLLSLCSGADQRKHQRSASLAFVRGIHRWPVSSPHKGPVTRKMFPFDDVIMSKKFCGTALYNPWSPNTNQLWNVSFVTSADFANIFIYAGHKWTHCRDAPFIGVVCSWGCNGNWPRHAMKPLVWLTQNKIQIVFIASNISQCDLIPVGAECLIEQYPTELSFHELAQWKVMNLLLTLRNYRKMDWIIMQALRWRHNGRDGISNHQPHDCLLNRLFTRIISQKTSKLRVTGLCVFPAQMASNAENVSISWRHHEIWLLGNFYDSCILHFTNW